MKKLLLIDNYDSFTYNLVQYFQELGVAVVVYRNDQITAQEARKLAPDYLVFSPGPGSVENPKDIGNGVEIFTQLRGKIPILGVCLGHQMIGNFFGGSIEKVLPVHGKRWPTQIALKTGVFKDFPDQIETMRYHSMVVNLPAKSDLKITAQFEGKERLVAAFEKTDEKIFGVQFHPESIGTKTGKQMLQNFLKTK